MDGQFFGRQSSSEGDGRLPAVLARPAGGSLASVTATKGEGIRAVGAGDERKVRRPSKGCHRRPRCRRTGSCDPPAPTQRLRTPAGGFPAAVAVVFNPTLQKRGKMKMKGKPARIDRIPEDVGPPLWRTTSGDAGGTRRRPPTVLGGLPMELHRPPAIRQASSRVLTEALRSVRCFNRTVEILANQKSSGDSGWNAFPTSLFSPLACSAQLSPPALPPEVSPQPSDDSDGPPRRPPPVTFTATTPSRLSRSRLTTRERHRSSVTRTGWTSPATTFGNSHGDDTFSPLPLPPEERRPSSDAISIGMPSATPTRPYRRGFKPRSPRYCRRRHPAFYIFIGREYGCKY
ncbi:uncharacterized protein LOC116247487 [Nymphaea colorata]|nr:uncharacterized protein LOC116247487 [Nymphaea colorata]